MNSDNVNISILHRRMSFYVSEIKKASEHKDLEKIKEYSEKYQSYVKYLVNLFGDGEKSSIIDPETWNKFETEFVEFYGFKPTDVPYNKLNSAFEKLNEDTKKSEAEIG